MPRLARAQLWRRFSLQSAGWFWKSRGLNELADADPEEDDDEDFVAITSLINGGRAGLADRIAYWQKAKRSLGLA